MDAFRDLRQKLVLNYSIQRLLHQPYCRQQEMTSSQPQNVKGQRGSTSVNELTLLRWFLSSCPNPSTHSQQAWGWSAELRGYGYPLFPCLRQNQDRLWVDYAGYS
ncbi:hypothetical protein RRG08_038686 [Elysia crispata]|uniref:Uncharacterized protein n=1 Tax=Elysia crispata TaxID=231223 RepID=A0AAE1DHN8_9GAST|nr:hypothetical protein RRG08_038686 [Elysia crispata]